MNRKLLGMVYEADEGRCFYCGIKVEPFGNWEPDHLLPKSRGGRDEFSNLVVACQPCNRSKGNRTLEEYREYLADRVYKHIALAHSFIANLAFESANGEHEIPLLLEKAADLAVNLRVTFPGDGVREYWLKESQGKVADIQIEGDVQ